MKTDDQRSDKTERQDAMELPVTEHQPSEVPVFGCLVYVSPNTAGGVRARVANLPGLECSASNERAALMAIVAAFKKCVAEHMQSDTPIPWIEPPSTMEPSEQQRSIPVHL